MTAKRILSVNGDFKHSPLMQSLRRVHRLFERHSLSYAVVGGLAVVRHGAVRTTADIDVLTSENGWEEIRRTSQREFAT